MKADLRVWNDFFDENNDKSFFLDDFWYTSEPLHLYTRFWCSFLKSLVLWLPATIQLEHVSILHCCIGIFSYCAQFVSLG